MPKLHHVKASTPTRKPGKSRPKCGSCGKTIEVGEPYWWWASRMPGARSGQKFIRCELHKPSAKDMVRNEFRRTLMDFEERHEEICKNFAEHGDIDQLRSELEDFAGEVRSFGEGQQEKFDNMPEGLQQGDTGQLLETRASDLEERANDIENAADQLDDTRIDEEDKEAVLQWATDEGEEKEEGESDEEFSDRMKQAVNEHNSSVLGDLVSEIEGAFDFNVD